MATRAQWNKCKQDTCPMDKYTTENCNMKRKPKYKKIKAWAWIRDGKVWDACVNKWSITKRLIPCEIRINTKYLKGGK